MSGADNFSFEDAGGAQAPSDALDRLNEKLAEAIALKEHVDQAESDLKAAKQQLQLLNTQTIPDMMTELGMDEVVQRGWMIKVSEFVSGSLPKDEGPRNEALAWLFEHDGRELIRTEVKVNFGVKEHNVALDLAGKLEAEGYEPSTTSGVHPQTLLAFARERIKNGEPLDTEVLGLYAGRVAKFKKVGDK